jgi:hypothetical protein
LFERGRMHTLNQEFGSLARHDSMKSSTLLPYCPPLLRLVFAKARSSRTLKNSSSPLSKGLFHTIHCKFSESALPKQVISRRLASLISLLNDLELPSHSKGKSKLAKSVNKETSTPEICIRFEHCGGHELTHRRELEHRNI